MERKINRIKLFPNDNNKSLLVTKELESELKKYNFQIVEDNYDLAISIGGDGSFLRMIKNCNFNENIYYIGVNSGTLGFLQEIDIKDTKDFVKKLNDNNFKNERINIEETTIFTDKERYHFNSLNEIVVRSNNFDTLKIPVYIDDELLENYTGDGLLISTSTGSTAYNMSFGGSILYNTLDTLSITPIAPLRSKVYNTLVNPIVIPSTKVVTLIPNKNQNNLFIMIDGVNKKIDNVSKIEIKIDNKSIKILRMNNFHFIKVINSKILDNK